jgi:hypothetical protein
VRETIKKRGKKILGEIVGKKKDVGRKFWKIILLIVPLHVAFFLAHLIKYLFYIFFIFSNVEGILSI